MAKLDPVRLLLGTIDTDTNVRIANYRWSVPIVWIFGFGEIIWKTWPNSHVWAFAELVICLIPMIVIGLIWRRDRRRATEESRRIRSPLNLP